MNNFRKAYIYGLKESKGDIIRYVGKSVEVEKRVKNHIKYSYKKNTHKDNWIQSVIQNDNQIEYVILEETNEVDWPEREMFWIKKLKNNNLTNHNNGGNGGGHLLYKISYEEAKKWMFNNAPNINNVREWYEFVKSGEKPKQIPSNPKEVFFYKGWKGWGDFLNTGRKWSNDVNYITYNNSKKYIKKNLKYIKTVKAWKLAAKENKIPLDIPNRPNRFYKNRGWKNWGDFLGTKTIANQNKNFISYEDAKIWLKNNALHIKGVNYWRSIYVKSKDFPCFLPKCPNLTYKKEWEGWKKFLGNLD